MFSFHIDDSQWIFHRVRIAWVCVRFCIFNFCKLHFHWAERDAQCGRRRWGEGGVFCFSFVCVGQNGWYKSNGSSRDTQQRLGNSTAYAFVGAMMCQLCMCVMMSYDIERAIRNEWENGGWEGAKEKNEQNHINNQQLCFLKRQPSPLFDCLEKATSKTEHVRECRANGLGSARMWVSGRKRACCLESSQSWLKAENEQRIAICTNKPRGNTVKGCNLGKKIPVNIAEAQPHSKWKWARQWTCIMLWYAGSCIEWPLHSY